MFTNIHSVSISRSTFILLAPQREPSAIELIVGAFQGHYVSRATHDNNEILDPPKCQPGTFMSLLDRLSNWIADESGVYMSWLHGPAGAGKSSVARSLAKILEDRGLLAGTFFFASTDTARNSEKPLVATLAQQIASSIPETQAYIVDSLLRDPAIISKSLETQFKKLIVDPIVRLTSASAQPPSFRPALIVIDGLDECEDPRARRLILDTLCAAPPRLHRWLRFLIASRPDDTFFQMKAVMGEHINFIDILSHTMHADLNQKFQQISVGRKSPSPTRTAPVAGTSRYRSQAQLILIEDLSPEEVTIVQGSSYCYLPYGLKYFRIGSWAGRRVP